MWLENRNARAQRPPHPFQLIVNVGESEFVREVLGQDKNAATICVNRKQIEALSCKLRRGKVREYCTDLLYTVIARRKRKHGAKGRRSNCGLGN